jgi:hypothetical protein
VQLRVLMSYGGEPGQLAPSERLFRDVMDVSFIEQRLLATAFKTEFASLVEHVDATLGAANAAVDKVQGCIQLKRLLKWVLALGNAMNDGYFGAQAKAFSLSSLLKVPHIYTHSSHSSFFANSPPVCRVVSCRVVCGAHSWRM